MKNKTRPKLKKECDKLWRQIVLETHPFCEVCQKPSCHPHHFFPKGNFSQLRYSLDNGIGLCNCCHIAHHFKGDPRIHQKIIEKRGIKWYQDLKKQAEKRPEQGYLNVKYYRDKLVELEKLSGNLT